MPKKPTLRCARCQKTCPYFIHLLTSAENPQFLLCRECLVAQQGSVNIIMPVLQILDHQLTPPSGQAMPIDMRKCDKCKLTFTCQRKYQKHNCAALGNGKSCHMCHGRFKHSQLLLWGSRLVCKPCDQQLVTSRSCGEAHLSEEKHACQRPSVERRSLIQVPDELLQQDKVYQCIKCQMSYKSEQEIRLHVLTYHNCKAQHYVPRRSFTCPYCHQSFFFEAQLLNHSFTHQENGMISDEEGADNLLCPKCEHKCFCHNQ